MKSRAAVFLTLVLLTAACGEGVGEEGPVSTTPPTTSPTSPATTSTTAAPSTTRPDPTTTTIPAAPWAAPGFPEARLPAEIPWDEVGPGWLLVRYARAAEDTDAEAPEALFLIDPEDTLYAVTGWDGREILDWSPDGTTVLIFHGTLRAIDLTDLTESTVPAGLAAGDDDRIDARFVPSGDYIVVRTLRWEEHVRLERWAADGTLVATLADFDFPAYTYGDPEFVQMGITWLSGPDGTEVAVATSDGISLLTDQGALIRPLDAPGLGCTLSRWWDEGSVLAACYDPGWAASECWYRGPMPDGRSLWAVPIDGFAATPLTPQPVCTTDVPEFSAAYEDGLPAGTALAASTGHCCECGGNLELIAGGTVSTWTGYPESLPCSPSLIAARAGRVLVLDTAYGSDPGLGTIGGMGVVFEVAGDGSTRAVTPIELGLFGGVRQALTTEEAGG